MRGKELEAVIQDFCKPNEYERYMMFIGDLEKVVSLLLCLSSRLARVQNAMRKIDENTDAEEKVGHKRFEDLVSLFLLHLWFKMSCESAPLTENFRGENKITPKSEAPPTLPVFV